MTVSFSYFLSLRYWPQSTIQYYTLRSWIHPLHHTTLLHYRIINDRSNLNFEYNAFSLTRPSVPHAFACAEWWPPAVSATCLCRVVNSTFTSSTLINKCAARKSWERILWWIHGCIDRQRARDSQNSGQDYTTNLIPVCRQQTRPTGDNVKY